MGKYRTGKKWDVKKGEIFNRLTVISDPFEKINSKGDKILYYWVECDCGNKKEIMAASLFTDIVSCGCFRLEVIKNNKMDEEIRQLHRLHNGMRKRCYNTNHEHFHYYGGREKPVIVCEEWLYSMEKFTDWAMANGYKKGLILDRIDPNGNYEPSNCRFVTVKESARNKCKPNLTATAFGETKMLMDWSEDPRCGIDYHALYKRIYYRGWDEEKAITTPARKVGI